MSILVTGGAGYIGNHTCIELLEAGYQVVVVDNLCNSSKKSLERVQEITGKELTFYQDDLLDSEALDAIFQRESIDAVIHFAGLKAVGESVQKPLEYYHNNLTGTFLLLEKMKKYQVKNFVFSSSRHGLRQSQIRADPGGFSPPRHQSLWQNQADSGGGAHRRSHS